MPQKITRRKLSVVPFARIVSVVIMKSNRELISII